MAWRAPVAGIGFTVGGLSLCGLPLLAGFSSKYSLAVAALAGEWQTMPTLFSLAVSSVLNAMYYIPAILVIWGHEGRGKRYFPVRKRASAHRWATLCFVAFNLVLGVGVGPILALIHTGLAQF